jgi:hypothetical protein
MQNGYIESFNGHMRDELLNGSLDLGQARQISPLGSQTTTRGGGIHRSATERRRPMSVISSQLAIALRYMRAPRDGQLIHRANGRINCRGSNRRWMKVQWQVTMTFKLAEMLKEVGKSSLMESEVVRSQAQTAAA